MQRSRANKKAVIKKPKIRGMARQIASDNRHKRRERVGEVRKVGGTVHLNREQFNARHLHCINIRMVYADIERTMSDHTSYGLGVPHKIKGTDYMGSMKAHCDHPEDGMCGQNPTDEQLAWINAKLSGKLFAVGVIEDGELDGNSPKDEQRDGTGSVRLHSIPVSNESGATTETATKPKFKFQIGGLNGSR